MSDDTDNSRDSNEGETFAADLEGPVTEFRRKKGPLDGPMIGVSVNAAKPTLTLPAGADVLSPAQLDQLFAEWRADYAAAKAERDDPPSGVSQNAGALDGQETSGIAKPPNHGTYQIWHEGKTHAVDVESTNVRDVWRMTKAPPEGWRENPAVTIHGNDPRRTRLGDVIVDPEFGAWEVQEDAFAYVSPPAPIADHMMKNGLKPALPERVGEWASGWLDAIDAHDRAHPARPEIELDGSERKAADKQQQMPRFELDLDR
jgi:hypothetical protein